MRGSGSRSGPELVVGVNTAGVTKTNIHFSRFQSTTWWLGNMAAWRRSKTFA